MIETARADRLKLEQGAVTHFRKACCHWNVGLRTGKWQATKPAGCRRQTGELPPRTLPGQSLHAYAIHKEADAGGVIVGGTVVFCHPTNLK